MSIQHGKTYSRWIGKSTPEKEDSTESFTIKEDETIQKINPRCGTLLYQMKFFTNKGNSYGPYGGDGGQMNTAECPGDITDASLAWINGSVVSVNGTPSFRNVQFGWAGNHGISSVSFCDLICGRCALQPYRL